MPKGSTCKAFGCTSNKSDNPELSFHSFPKNKERFKLWCDLLKRPDLKHVDVLANRLSMRVCSLHFEDRMYMSPYARSRLIWCALPKPVGEEASAMEDTSDNEDNKELTTHTLTTQDGELGLRDDTPLDWSALDDSTSPPKDYKKCDWAYTLEEDIIVKEECALEQYEDTQLNGEVEKTETYEDSKDGILDHHKSDGDTDLEFTLFLSPEKPSSPESLCGEEPVDVRGMDGVKSDANQNVRWVAMPSLPPETTQPIFSSIKNAQGSGVGVKKLLSDISFVSPAFQKDKAYTKAMASRELKKKYTRLLNKHRQRYHILLKKYKALEEKVVEVEDVGTPQQVVRDARKYLSDDHVQFLESQMFLKNRSGTGNRFSKKFMSLMIQYYKRSAAGYRFLRTIFTIPSVKTVQKWMNRPLIVSEDEEEDFMHIFKTKDNQTDKNKRKSSDNGRLSEPHNGLKLSQNGVKIIERDRVDEEYEVEEEEEEDGSSDEYDSDESGMEEEMGEEEEEMDVHPSVDRHHFNRQQMIEEWEEEQW